MRKRTAKIMVFMGIVCVIAALSLFVYNKIQSSNAAKFAEAVFELQKSHYQENGDNQKEQSNDNDQSIDYISGTQMDTVAFREYEFIGYLSIPVLRLNLPVMADWSYDNLNLSPCRYSGSPSTDDFVIAAHNYSSHFGFISSLNRDDTVSFIDVHGQQIDYHVELIDTLSSADVKNMTSGEYDLTLFTCTYSGQARITVRCSRITPYDAK